MAVVDGVDGGELAFASGVDQVVGGGIVGDHFDGVKATFDAVFFDGLVGALDNGDFGF